MRKLRVGIVGAGGLVADVHFEAYRALSTIEVVAGAELDEAALARVTRKWGVTGYVDVEQMLAKEALDIVCICVPARYHRAVAEKVAAHKVHILIEKPLATTLEDGQAIIDICDRHGVKLYYGASYRSLTANIKAREMIRSGAIGDVSMAMEIVIGGKTIGTVTSGGFSPTMGRAIAMGYVERSQSANGTKVDLMVRGKPVPAEIVAMPFVKHAYYRG